MKAYHFHGQTLRGGLPVPPIDETLLHHGPVVPCKSGFHGSEDPFDALQYAQGPILDLVELDGDLQSHGDPVDKWVGRRRTRLASIDSTELLRSFARWCALQVIDKWDAPAVVREYLETGDDSKQAAAWAAARNAARNAASDAASAAAWAAAMDAAWAAARAVAWAAAMDAAMDAASAAAMDAQRKKFGEMVDEAFRKAGDDA